MISLATAKKLNSSIVTNMGLIGSTIDMARSSEPEDKAVIERIQLEQRALTNLLVSVVGYLSRLDESLKIQTKITQHVYNQQVLSQREQGIEQPATRVQPDAVPVAANDNEVEKTGSSLGALASALLIGATALLFTNFKTISEKLKSAASMLGLGADVAAQRQYGEQPTAEPSELTVTPPITPTAKPPKSSPPDQQGMPVARPVKSNALPESAGGSNPVGATQGNRVSAPAAIPLTTSSSSQPAAPAATPSSSTSSPGEKSAAVGDVPTDIVQLGKYLQKQGYRISGHSQFGGREFGQHSTNSKHYTDNALDVNVGSGVNEATHPVYGPQLDQLAAKLKKAGYSVIWRADGHYNHLHVQRGGTSNVGSGDNQGIFGSEGLIAQSLETVQKSLSETFKHFKPTNLMSRKIGDEALKREMDLLAKPKSTGFEQGELNKPEGAKVPSPVQQSVVRTGEDVTSQYMFMFFGEKPKAATVSNLTQAK